MATGLGSQPAARRDLVVRELLEELQIAFQLGRMGVFPDFFAFAMGGWLIRRITRLFRGISVAIPLVAIAVIAARRIVISRRSAGQSQCKDSGANKLLHDHLQFLDQFLFVSDGPFGLSAQITPRNDRLFGPLRKFSQ